MGDNPVDGVVIPYWFDAGQTGKVTLAILDNDGVNRIRSAREQLEGSAERGDEGMAAAAKDLSVKLLDIEDTLHFPGRLTSLLGGLGGVVASAEGQPTAQSYEVFDGLRTQTGDALASLASLLDTELEAFNARVNESDTAAVAI